MSGRDQEFFWNERYAAHKSVYGSEPNAFFAQELSKLKPGRLWLPADGEGRNSVFAALQGWQVEAFDFSPVAIRKAQAFALEKGVSVDYTICDIDSAEPHGKQYEAIGLLYVHMKQFQRKSFHSKCVEALRHGGTLILEAFTPEQLQYSSGGPREALMLYTPTDLAKDFAELDILVNETKTVFLQEGQFHSGPGSVIRFVGKRR